MELKRSSPSKINLYLSIKGKLDNGYHEIDTVFLPLNTPSDDIIITNIENNFGLGNNGIKITSSSSEVPCNDKNLCWKAVNSYNNKTGANISCSIHIEKRIPIAAGMGGGSSNAATVLSILNERYNLLDDTALAQLALSLGADVPFFLNPKLSFATGVGEKLIPVDFKYKHLPIIIIAPHFPVSAAWAYSHCKISQDIDTPIELVLNSVKESKYEDLAKLVRNDLARPLYEKFPILSIIKESAIDAGALCCEVSGSGPTMFAICKSRESVSHITQKLLDILPNTFSVIEGY